MNNTIGVIRKELFQELLKNNRPNLSKLRDALFVYNEFTLELPCKFQHSSLKHSLQKNRITEDLLTGIICFLLKNRQKRNQDRFEFSVEDFQKIFAHFNQKDLKLLGEKKRSSYNNLIQKLAVENKDFEGVCLNANWQVSGSEKCISVQLYLDKLNSEDQEDSNISDDTVDDLGQVDVKENETFLNIGKTGSLFKRYRTLITYIFGFLFSWLGYIVMPIVVLGIYITQKQFTNPKVRKKRYLAFALMTILFLAFQFFVLPKIRTYVNEKNKRAEKGLYQDAFETEYLSLGGNGFVTIHNRTTSGLGKNIGLSRKTTAKVGDTVSVSVLVANIGKTPLENVKAELSPRTSGLNKKHTFFGTLDAFNAQKVTGSCYLSTYNDTKLRSLNNVSIQKDGAKSQSTWFVPSEIHSLYNGGYTFGRLFPGSENYVIITSLYVVEQTSSTRESIGFDPDPSKMNMGFLTINDQSCTNNCANKKDVIEIPILKSGDSFSYFTYIDFRNWGGFDIQNARANLFFDYDDEINEMLITSELSGENVPSIYDTTRIINLPNPDYANIIFEHGRAVNYHQDSSSWCHGYDLNIEFSEKDLEKGIFLDVLDTYKDGWCDQGYVICKFTLVRD